MWEKSYSICVADAAFCRYVRLDTSVLMFRWSYVPSVNSMVCPRVTLTGFSWMMTLVPGGANGVVLKSNIPQRYAKADMLELIRLFLRWLRVRTACGISRFCYRKFWVTGCKASQEMIFECSNCSFCGVSSMDMWWRQLIVNFIFAKAVFNSPEISLSKMYKFNPKTTAYSDLTGRFPYKSSRGNQYILIVYDYDSNAILAEPLSDRRGHTITKTWQKINNVFVQRGVKPNFRTSNSNIQKSFPGWPYILWPKISYSRMGSTDSTNSSNPQSSQK